MSGQPAVSGAPGSRLLLVDAGQAKDIFDVVEIADAVVRVRTAFLFELGEEMNVRLEAGDTTYEASARVRAHVGTGDERITELELENRVSV